MWQNTATGIIVKKCNGTESDRIFSNERYVYTSFPGCLLGCVTSVAVREYGYIHELHN